jgi:hypothetical protein
VGKDGNPPGFPDNPYGLIKIQARFGHIEGFPFPQIPGESLFPVSYDSPFYQKGGKMGPPQGSPILSQGKQFLPACVDAHLVHTVKNFPVSRLPAPGKFGYRFPEGRTWLPDSQPKQMEFPGAFVLNFYFNTGNKEYPLFPGLVFCAVQALDSIVIG